MGLRSKSHLSNQRTLSGRRFTIMLNATFEYESTMSDLPNAIRKLHRLMHRNPRWLMRLAWHICLVRPRSGVRKRLQSYGKMHQRRVRQGEKHTIIYVHAFCKSICVCNERLRPSRPELLQEYWIGACRALSGSHKHTIAELPFSDGGGTPSTLPAKLLDQLLNKLSAYFSGTSSSRQLEFDPAILNRRKLEVLHRHGFKRFSLGCKP